MLITSGPCPLTTTNMWVLRSVRCFGPFTNKSTGSNCYVLTGTNCLSVCVFAVVHIACSDDSGCFCVK